jgi:hypothetical protein
VSFFWSWTDNEIAALFAVQRFIHDLKLLSVHGIFGVAGKTDKGLEAGLLACKVYSILHLCTSNNKMIYSNSIFIG